MHFNKASYYNSLPDNTHYDKKANSENSRADTPLKNGNWMDNATTVCTFGVLDFGAPYS